MNVNSTNLDPQALESLYNECKQIIDQMIDSINETKTIVNKMNNYDHWDGNGYDNFNAKFNALADNFFSFCNDLYQLNNNIQSSIERYKNLENEIMRGIPYGI